MAFRIRLFPRCPFCCLLAHQGWHFDSHGTKSKLSRAGDFTL